MSVCPSHIHYPVSNPVSVQATSTPGLSGGSRCAWPILIPPVSIPCPSSCPSVCAMSIRQIQVCMTHPCRSCIPPVSMSRVLLSLPCLCNVRQEDPSVRGMTLPLPCPSPCRSLYATSVCPCRVCEVDLDVRAVSVCPCHVIRRIQVSEPHPRVLVSVCAPSPCPSACLCHVRVSVPWLSGGARCS